MPHVSKKLVAVTSCPTGIAHTYMAAEALQKAAAAKQMTIKVETRGSIGAENVLTDDDIREADAVIIAANTQVDKSRFAGKPLIEVGVGDAIKDPAGLIDRALAAKPDLVAQVEEIKKERKAQATGWYKHLMTGVSYMIPFTVAGGILIAISFMFGIEAAATEGTFAYVLNVIGGQAGFGFMVPILAAFIAYSIADRPGIAPGMAAGFLANSVGAGFLGAIVGGFLAGYLVFYLNKWIRLPRTLEGMKPVLILPLLGVGITGLIMVYVLNEPMAAIMAGLQNWLTGLSGGSAVVLGLILGAMMAFDMGGPVNKAAYAFGTGLLASQVYEPMAAVMAAGMTPPLGLFLATLLAPKKYTDEEREAGKAAAVLGISFITEGAIPFAAADPFRVIPAIMAGSAVTGALSMAFGAKLMVPHGGIWVLPMGNVITNLGLYLVAIAIGTVVTALVVNLLKPNKE
ncbi:PTS fructose transporter subunit IIC [Symbiobacterium terraclitae]|uniref:PTS fructose transporter subunit IIC n=1 Tax=Symbiobacterium terraclitae TaxID=557451 RepID=UPI001AE4917F